MKRFMNRFVMMLAVCVIMIAGKSADVQAASLRDSIGDAEGDSYAYVAVEGTFTSASKEEILKRVNEIRKEACQEGVPNPDSPEEKLTMNDYSEVKWSADLEKIAMMRAVEASIVQDHVRPNGESCFSVKSNNIRSGSETLAWGSSTPVGGINLWYGEKSDWVNQVSGAVTGHYTAMINPSLKYIGVATFSSEETWPTTAGEYNYGWTSITDESKSTVTSVRQKVQVLKSGLSKLKIRGKSSLAAGTTGKISVGYDYSFVDDWGDTCSIEVLCADTVTYSSSNVKVVKVDNNGKITAAA